MGQEDISEKHLEEIKEIFADIVNGTLFAGKQIVKEHELSDISVRAQYKADDGKLHEQERDVSKKWEKEGIVFSLIGIENQTRIDMDMTLRILAYDGASYRSQLLKDPAKKAAQKRYPVITIVLYYGKEPWNVPNNLKSRLEVPPFLEKFVSDYTINVFDISHMKFEKIDTLFRSDYRIFARIINKTKKIKELVVKSTDIIKYPDQLLKLLRVITKDEKFEIARKKLPKNGGELMGNDFADYLEERGFEKGFQQGQKQGLTSLKETAIRMLNDGMTPESVHKYVVDISLEEIKELHKELEKTKS